MTAIELFAGVGGFRLGLEKHGIEVIWSNQWEPSTKKQHASMIYEARFGSDNHHNIDINEIDTRDIPDHDILCAGFPCQDYSVATTLNNSKGIQGKKGVLWWSIYRIINEKVNKPRFVILENVDRLLSSPVNQRGRDFSIILECLNLLGYSVEWRVINPADYGMPQRRKRVFILAHLHNSIPSYKPYGILNKAFPIETNVSNTELFMLDMDIQTLSDKFNLNGSKTPYQNTGTMLYGEIETFKTNPKYDGHYTVLRDIIEDKVDSSFYLEPKTLERWEYLKGSKKIERVSSNGHKYYYTEGSMSYPDSLNKPSRTIITGEGGKSPSRFKHVIETDKGLRRLTPVELERLNMFPDNHTKLEGVSDTKRAFLMGNALVVGVVERIVKEIIIYY